MSIGISVLTDSLELFLHRVKELRSDVDIGDRRRVTIHPTVGAPEGSGLDSENHTTRPSGVLGSLCL